MTQSNQWYLGKVDFLPAPHTRISCFAKAVNGEWVTSDLTTELPPFSKVFVKPRALYYFEKDMIHQGSIFAITAEEDLDSEDVRHDTYIVRQSDNIKIPRIVLDLRNKTMEQIRYQLIEKGLDGFDSIILDIEEIIIAINNEQCLVLDLQKHPVYGRYITSTGIKEIFEFDNIVKPIL